MFILTFDGEISGNMDVKSDGTYIYLTLMCYMTNRSVNILQKGKTFSIVFNYFSRFQFRFK
jgi:hypothetical protein